MPDGQLLAFATIAEPLLFIYLVMMSSQLVFFVLGYRATPVVEEVKRVALPCRSGPKPDTLSTSC